MRAEALLHLRSNVCAKNTRRKQLAAATIANPLGPATVDAYMA